MDNEFNLEKYLSKGIESLVKDALKTSIKNPKTSAFFLKYALSAKKAEKIRHEYEVKGEHIPSFLIASITGKCNLKCAGCYDKANENCRSHEELNRDKWDNIFKEAEEIGVSAILIAGGEPLVKSDVIDSASKHSSILFPVFTNGTMLNDKYIEKFYYHRNLIPIISIEGNEVQTDIRRGDGVYKSIMTALEKLKERNLLFGVSVTVTKENISTVTNDEYIDELWQKGCRAIVFVEYVPIENREIAISDEERSFFERRVKEIRESKEMIIISFPGDEVEYGGCLAAGRGFFHINAAGGAEPCPFSPYSDTNLKNVSLREALKSPLFRKLRDSETLIKEHVGGCTLFEQSTLVQGLLAGE